MMNETRKLTLHPENRKSFFKGVVLLAFGLFMIAAPSPDATQLTEITSGLISMGII